MSLTVQNLRAVGPGIEPTSLLPGQIAFNVTDKILYVGDGSNFKTNFDGTQVAGVAGEGWYAMPMDFSSLGDYYVANPGYYGDVPTDQQVLTWSSALNHPIWTSGGGGGGGNQVYVVTNSAVAAAPGSTTSDKISAAIGVASPDEGDVAIVTGLPDDVYEGLYFFTTQWVKGAAYAYPSASEVIYDNTVTGLTPTVQGAIDDLDAAVQVATSTANTANSTANSALSIANAALPKAGGTMTGTLVSQDINVPSGFGVLFNNGITGTIAGITDSISTTSSSLAASATGVKVAYDLAAAALSKAGGTMTGAITFAAGQVFPVSGIQDATGAQKGVVQIGTNIQVAAGTISILDATTSNKGVVQLNDTLTSTSTIQALTARGGKDLQDQINALTLSSSVTLAGSVDAATGLLDSVTTQGASAGFVAGSALPSPAAGNADYYVLVTVAGSYSPPGGGGPYAAEPGDWFLSDGATWQYLGVGARPQSATYTTAGIVQLADTTVTYTGTSDTEAITPNSLQNKMSDSIALSDSNRVASSTAVKTAYDIGAAAVPCSTITAVGDIVVGGAGATPTALPVGTDGQVLVANSACSSGLEWVSDTPGDVTSVTATSPVTADNTDPQNPIIGIDAASTTQAGAVQLNDTVTSTSTTEAATANAAKTAYDKGVAACTIAQAAIPCACFTGLGELLTGTGAGTFSALPVGADGQVLLADSLAPEGLAWGNACYVPDACFTAVGEIIVGTGVGSYVALPVGTDGQLLVADSACSEGVKWGGISLVGYTCTATPFNTALGQNAGDSITTGTCNTVVGYDAGTTLAGGSGNTFIGMNAGNAVLNALELTAVGYNALSTTASAQGSTAVGAYALDRLTTGLFNTAVGYRAGCALTVGTCNTIVGDRAGQALNNGNENTLLGHNTGRLLSSGCNNLLLGFYAGCAVTTGSNNTILGEVFGSAGLSDNLILAAGTTIKFQANASGAWSPDGTNYGTIGQVLTSNGTVAAPTWNTLSLACVPCAAFTACGDLLVGTGSSTFTALPTGTNGQTLLVDTTCTATGGLKWGTALTGFTCAASPFNTALGQNAGDSITTGSGNTLVGYDVGTNLTTGANNTAIGTNAGASTVGSNNTLVGHCAGNALGVAGSNTFIGGISGFRSTVTDGSVGVGYCTFAAVMTGDFNNALGYRAGETVTSGTRNTFVGPLAGRSVTTGSNNVILGGFAGSAALADNVVLSTGGATPAVRFQANNSGAWSPDGTNYGTSGQILTSSGTAAAPAWTSALPQVTAPTASTDTGVEGQIASDSTYFYMYTGGRWQRVAWDTTGW